MRRRAWMPLSAISLVSCLSRAALVTRGTPAPSLSTVKCIAVEVVAFSPDRERLQSQLITDLRAALPGVEVTPSVAVADLLIQYQQEDMIICVDCGDANGKRGQYWSWFVSLARREFDPTCGANVSKLVATVWGENHKVGSRPTKAAAREVRKLLLTGPG